MQVSMRRGRIDIPDAFDPKPMAGVQALVAELPANPDWSDLERIATLPQELLALTAPIDDLLGLRSDSQYAAIIGVRYKPFWWGGRELPQLLREQENTLKALEAWRTGLEQQIRDWLDEGLPDLFLGAVREAAEAGTLSATLAPYVAQIVRRPPPRRDEVPDLPTLATWALDHLMRRSQIEVRTCPTCDYPWLAVDSDHDVYCTRPTPGKLRSCREIHNQQAFEEAQKEWRREYKKLHERKSRGTLPAEEFAAWRAANRPSSWLPFEEWKASALKAGSARPRVPRPPRRRARRRS
jgi:Zn-finger nucleic acid-binding protein